MASPMGKLSQPLAAVTEEVSRRPAVFVRERSLVALPFGEGARRAGEVGLVKKSAVGKHPKFGTGEI